MKKGDTVQYIGPSDQYRGRTGIVIQYNENSNAVNISWGLLHSGKPVWIMKEYVFVTESGSEKYGKMFKKAIEEQPKQVAITTKSMVDVLKDNDCWFDSYGNLTSKHGHLAPSHFQDLGKTIMVNDGCGWTTDDNNWLKVIPKKYEKWI